MSMTTTQVSLMDPKLTQSNEERNLVRTAKVTAIVPIEGADAIEAAKVGGWTVVVKKDEFVAGDTAVYFEIDSALPLDDERFEFLAPRGEKVVNDRRCHVLKTARLRGVYSQGLLLPLDQFPEIPAGAEDVTDLLGITKYEPPMPENIDVVGRFPTNLGRKTTSERVQNLPDHWNLLRNESWLATEKADGVSLSVFRDGEGELHVCSRNWELAEPASPAEANIYWRAVYETGMADLLDIDMGFQAEIVGPGTPRNPLGLDKMMVMVFAFIINGKAMERYMWPVCTLEQSTHPDDNLFRAPIYPEGLLGETVEETVENVSGIKSLVSPGRLAEGVVFHHADGRQFESLGGRPNFKVLSNKFLLKNGG